MAKKSMIEREKKRQHLVDVYAAKRAALKVVIANQDLPVAERFAAAPDAPHQLIRRLANDEAEDVAQPVLRASPVLTEADLIQVIRSRGQGHIRAVSQRCHAFQAICAGWLLVNSDRGN